MSSFSWLRYGLYYTRGCIQIASILWKAYGIPVWWNLRRLTTSRDVQERRAKIIIRLMHRTLRVPGVSGFSWVENSNPGYGEQENRAICWETPTGFVLWFDDRPLVAVGLEFGHATLSIRQLQGVKGSKIPEEIKDWPVRMVRMLVRYARLTGMKRVRIYRAHTSMFYTYPDLDLDLGPAYYGAREKLRERMRIRYDGTARKAGFTKYADYYELLLV
jgi:hypothetical protein